MMAKKIKTGNYQGSYSINTDEIIPYQQELIETKNQSIVKMSLGKMQSYRTIFDKTYCYFVGNDLADIEENSLYPQEATVEHMAKLFIGQKEDVDNLTSELILAIETNPQILIDYEKSYTDYTIEFAQCNLEDNYSILHIMVGDMDVIQEYEKVMNQEVINKMLFSLETEDLFNSYHNYGDKWFTKNTSNDIILAYYKTYLNNEQIMYSLEYDCQPMLKKAKKLLEKEMIQKEKESLEGSIKEVKTNKAIKV